MSPADDNRIDPTDTAPPGADGSEAGAVSAKREIAVALHHEQASDKLPKIIASGKGAVARQILEIAFDRGIKVREDSDLAEVLSAMEIDSDIPLPAFAAVAEILSYVYRASAGTGSVPDDAPEPDKP